MLQLLQSYKSGELWLAEVPVPACGKGGIVIQNRASFVSAGTEKMLVDFAKKGYIGKARAMPDQVQKVIRKIKTEGFFSTIEKVKAKLDQPIPLGYSCAGLVEEAGPGITNLSRGDRVACGGAGYANHAEYNFVLKNLAVRIPDNVSFEDASCATVGSIALQGVRQCDLRLGENACVIGLGLLGLLAVQMFKAGGIRVIGFDPNHERCQLARDLGIDIAVERDMLPACNDFSQGMGMDAVLITAATKSNEPVTAAGEIARAKGRVVVTGMVGLDIPRDMYYKKELDFKLSLSYGPGRYDSEYEEGGHDYPYSYVRWTEQRNMAAFLDLVSQGKITPGKLITHRFAIDDALQAYELLLGKRKEPYLGIVLTYPEKKSGTLTEQKRISIKRKKPPGEEIKGKPGIAFIGAGNFAKGVLIPQFQNRDDVIKKAVCDVVGMTATETAKKYGFEYGTTDVDTILKDSTVQAVVITTQHNSHADLVTRSLNAGKHVYVEKPLAINREQLKSVSQACYATSQILMLGFNRRFTKHAALIKEYFTKRNTPMIVNYRINAGLVPAGNWIHHPDIGGGRIIGEACHFIDLAGCFIGSRAVEVSASSISTDNALLRSDDNVSITIKYEDGSLASIQYIALGSPDLPKERCEVYADESVAVMDNFSCTVCTGKRGKKRLKGSQDKGFREEIDAFITSITKGGEAAIPVESIFEATEISFAVLDALQTKSLITLKTVL